MKIWNSEIVNYDGVKYVQFIKINYYALCEITMLYDKKLSSCAIVLNLNKNNLSCIFF